MSLDNDYERFAYDLVKFIIDRGGYRATDELCKIVSEKLMQGPNFTLWPRDAAEANQRARDRAAAAAIRRPELPRPLTAPGLPRPLSTPTLPRGPLVAPSLPRPLAPPPLPRLLKP
jgi:hypothetical protein